MKTRIISLILLLTIIAGVESLCVTKAKQDNKKKPRKNPDVALSIDLMDFPITHKQLEGYHEDYRNRKGLTSEDEEGILYDVTYPRILSENNEVIYKNGSDGVGLQIISKYGDEVFSRIDYQSPYRWREKYRAINVKTKEVRALYANSKYKDYSCYPMFYKDKMYYIKNGKDNSEFNTYIGSISVANIDGTFIKQVKLPKFDEKSSFLGIAHDKFYYVSTRENTPKITTCDLDGSNFKVVAKGFRYNLTRFVEKYTLSYDKTGWYFLGGRKKPYRDLCKLDFKTGKAKVIIKNVEEFDVGAKYIYYTEYTDRKTKNVCRLNKRNGKESIFVRGTQKYLNISGGYLYFRPDMVSGAYKFRRTKIVGPDAGKKIEKIWYTP